jgi:type II pantothenate kinase
MLSNNIAQIGYLNAKQYGLKRIFFSGGFLQENEFVWARFSYGVDFWSKGEMAAMFLQHNSYLGALGALLSPNDASKTL